MIIQFFYLNGSNFNTTRASLERRFILTAYINKRALFKSGNGTLEDPYVVR
ncbi:MAG: hypothetical protein L6V81_00265 [Clostridium sp.]|nr:MAG: hypothetical protein L6V81_00265 [Clostridium sp.]